MKRIYRLLLRIFIIILILHIIIINYTFNLDVEGISRYKIDVEWRSDDHNFTVIKNGIPIMFVPYTYGPSFFNIHIKDGPSFEVGNWRTDVWSWPDYSCKITKLTHKYKLEFIANDTDYIKVIEYYNRQGKLIDTARTFYKNGNIECISPYKDGKLHGEVIRYKSNGLIDKILFYKNGEHINQDKHHLSIVQTHNNKGSIMLQKLKVQDTLNKPCNIYYLTTLELHLENPSDKEIENFLLTFDASCQTNAEYSEYSNELLFNLLHKFPDKLISILKKNNNIHFRYILKELQKPVNDGIEIDEIVKQMQSRKDTIAIKILEALDKIQ